MSDTGALAATAATARIQPPGFPSGSASLRRKIARLAVCAAALCLAACGPKRVEGPLDSYVTDMGAVQAEFLRYAGRAIDPGAAGEVERARRLAVGGDYRGAIGALNGVAARARIPAVYHNLAVLYAAVGDVLNARESYGAALGVDPGYRAARAGLGKLISQQRITGLLEDAPVTQEVEPNNTPSRANMVALDVPVTGAVADQGDLDCFRFRTPPPPRDILEVSITNRSATLIPTLRLFDGEQRFMLWNKEAAKPGVNLTQLLSAEPSSNYSLEIWGLNRTSGAYTLKVRALKAFDAFEPNDDILHPTPYTVGTTIDANIMDARDNDYYQFTSPRDGNVAITLTGRAATLIPALAVYGPDRTLIGFGPDAQRGGQTMSYSVNTVMGQTYYIQVWGRGQTSGAYALTAK